MNWKKWLVVVMACFALPALADPAYAPSFEAAKRTGWQIYKDHRVDQYCGCEIGSGNKPDLAGCGYQPRKDAKRAARIEWEHVVPAENLGRQFPCWKQGGREFCNANDPAFRNAHNDLHNLMPVIGEVNGDRSNFRYDELAVQPTQYGQCQFIVDFEGRRAEPPENLKGDVARIHFYMRDQHGLRLSPQQEKLFEAWSKMDPVSDWERTRDARIYQIQGTSNPYVSRATQGHGETVVSPLAPRQVPSVTVTKSAEASYSCERKTCAMISSCEEARHQLTTCGNRSLDRNGDGVPCESLCR